MSTARTFRGFTLIQFTQLRELPLVKVAGTSISHEGCFLRSTAYHSYIHTAWPYIIGHSQRDPLWGCLLRYIMGILYRGRHTDSALPALVIPGPPRHVEELPQDKRLKTGTLPLTFDL